MTVAGRIPRPLVPGDLVAIISPGGHCDPERVVRGARMLESWGLRVRIGQSATKRYGYLSAPDSVRLSELQAALDDREVRAVMATRGGFGADRIVDQIRLHDGCLDKFFVGFSDNTSLHLRFLRAGISTLYGPPIAWDGSRNGPASEASLQRALMKPWRTGQQIAKSDPGEPTAALTTHGARVVSGQVVGGNLAMIAAAMGTKTAPDLCGRVVFLEDIQEPPFRVDRMIVQLRRAGGLNEATALLLGQFTRCLGVAGAPTVLETLGNHVAELGLPVLGGLRVGHGQDQQTLLLGANAAIDFERHELVLQLERP